MQVPSVKPSEGALGVTSCTRVTLGKGQAGVVQGSFGGWDANTPLILPMCTLSPQHSLSGRGAARNRVHRAHPEPWHPVHQAP